MLLYYPTIHYMDFHLLVSSSISFFFQGLNIFIVQDFHFWIRFIPGYFLEAIGNAIVSMISFSVCLSFVYLKATHFCMPILYPDTLLSIFLSCRTCFFLYDLLFRVAYWNILLLLRFCQPVILNLTLFLLWSWMSPYLVYMVRF